MRYHFDLEQVKRLVEHSRAAEKHKILYDSPSTDHAGLWIVGDDGVYMMSNGDPGLLRSDDAPDRSLGIHFIVYADEVNPKTMEVDVWWDAKRAGFGADDGVEFLLLIDIDRQLRNRLSVDKFCIDITPNHIGIPYAQARARKRSDKLRAGKRNPKRSKTTED